MSSLRWTKFLIRTGIARFLPAARRLTDGGAEYLHYYSDRVLAAPISELLDSSTFPEAGPDVLDLNDPVPRLEFAATLGRVTSDAGHRPSAWGLPALREAIAEQYRARDGRAINPAEELLITRGATGGYAAVLDAFVNPGDRVVLFDPSSPTFALGAQSRRARIRWVETSTTDGLLRFDPKVLAESMRGAKLLVLADPGTPTGAILRSEDQEQIADLARRHDVLVYLDESLSRFRYDSGPNILARSPAMTGRLISAGSMTYGYGLQSLRLGWLSGSKHLLRPTVLTANLAGPYVPVPCQQAAVKALATDEDLFGPVVEEFRARRRYTASQLRGMGFTVVEPSGGLSFWLSVAEFGLDGRMFAERLLREQKVLVGPGTAFGLSGTNFIRVSFAGDDGRLREGLARLGRFVNDLRGEPTVQTGTIAVPGEEAKPEETSVEVRSPSFSRV